jgi:NADH-quinone oxidoreductase subunit J
VGGAALVAFVRNILYSALGLLAALLGAGSLYVLLSADFVAITQLLVYVGGVLVLVLFAVMLTNRITEVTVSNRSVGLWGGLLLLVAMAPVLVAVAVATPWNAAREPGPLAPLAPTTAAIGDALLTRWLLPFEVASLILLATLVGAVVIARKELKEGDTLAGPGLPAALASPARPDAAP